MQIRPARELLLRSGIILNQFGWVRRGLPMSEFAIETSEERRARYVRLARAATDAAAKSPLLGAKEMYVKLAQAWVAMADEADPGPGISCDGEDIRAAPSRDGLNVKLNGMP
jgi:hypothetical protein